MSLANLFFNLPPSARPSTAHLAVIIGHGLIQRRVPFDTMGKGRLSVVSLLLLLLSLFFRRRLSSPLMLSLSCVLFRPVSVSALVPPLLFARVLLHLSLAERQAWRSANADSWQRERERQISGRGREGEGRAVDKYLHGSNISNITFLNAHRITEKSMTV